MASVFLLSAAPADTRPRHGHAELEEMCQLARSDRFGVHRLVDEPRDADVVMFVEHSTDTGPYFELVRRHPVYRAFRDKSCLFCSTDRFVPFLPGVFASLERSWHRSAWTRPGFYLGIGEDEELHHRPDDEPPAHLFSFVGSSATHRVRRRLLDLDHPDALLIDTHGERSAPDDAGLATYRRRYADALRGSAFVLCPRGGGSSSFRLFETMMLGRVPVVISDEWVPPVGPDWDAVSVRVPERDVSSIPALLEARRGEAAAMGAAARATWQDWFSEEAAFHRIVDSCVALVERAPARAGFGRTWPYWQMLRPYHAARWTARRLGIKG